MGTVLCKSNIMSTSSSAIVSDDGTQFISGVTLSDSLFDVGAHVQVVHGKGYVSADLGREVGIETKPLQVNTQHLREFDNTHLLLTVLKFFASSAVVLVASFQLAGVKESIQAVMNIGRRTSKHVSDLRHEIDDRAQASAEGAATLPSGRAGLGRLLLYTLLRLGHFFAARDW
jgi:hypothetical protein